MGTRRSETRTIDGLRVTVHQFVPSRAFPMSIRVGKILAALLGAVDFQALRRGEISASAALHILDALDRDQALMPDLLSACQVVVTAPDGKGQEQEDLGSDGMIDRVFAGKLATMLRVALFSASVNFADFFADAFGIAATEAAKEAAKESD